jgi:hypothetical protein
LCMRLLAWIANRNLKTPSRRPCSSGWAIAIKVIRGFFLWIEELS